MKRYFPFVLHTVALVAVLILIISHIRVEGALALVPAILAIIAGYLIGSWTCHIHQLKRGFWVTMVVFVLLNLVHSVIDGASVGDITSFAQGLAVLSHEFARQPALYVVLWGMLTPFVKQEYRRLFVVPVVVTGTWFVGAYIGYHAVEAVAQVAWLEGVADWGLFLFLGDIAHHIREEYRKLRNVNDCCHQH
jgi:hypothetical protein